MNKITMNLFYSKLAKLGIQPELLDKVAKDKDFKEMYRKEIIPFIDYLQTYTYKTYKNGVILSNKLELDVIKQHVNNLLETYTKEVKYISFVKELMKFDYSVNLKIEHAKIINDSNFDVLYQKRGLKIFRENIEQICESAHSDRLLIFLSKYPLFDLDKINPEFFTDEVWKEIESDYKINGEPLFIFFESNIDTFIEIIHKGYLDGLKYTYENIPESHEFIEKDLKMISKERIEQFNPNFIQNIGLPTLKILYKQNCFSASNYEKLYKIASVNNFELIKDITNYDINNSNISLVREEDITKNILEISTHYKKNDILMYKYLGLNFNESYYIAIFLKSLSKIECNEDFKEKYNPMIALLNQILNASDEEIIEISKHLDISKKEEYHNLIQSLESEGNELLKENFSQELQKRNNKMKETIPTKLGNIDVYEFKGQPFTMLVHTIHDNKLSSNNHYVKEILENPQKWYEINQGNNFISTSLITNDFIRIYGGIPEYDETIIFGFDNIPAACIKSTDVRDSGTNRDAAADASFNMRDRIHPPRANTVATIDEIMQISKSGEKHEQTYNEIVIKRNFDEEKIKPSYIVCMDKINDSSKKAAEDLNIPIYLINLKYYENLNKSDVQEMENQYELQNQEQIEMENEQHRLR